MVYKIVMFCNKKDNPLCCDCCGTECGRNLERMFREPDHYIDGQLRH